jgi:hypothetical protein
MIPTLLLLSLYVWWVWYRSYTIRIDGKPYLTRYYPLGKLPRLLLDCNVFLHHFHASDERVYHDHPWKESVSLILWGGYEEFRCAFVRHFNDDTRGSIFAETSRVHRPLSVNRLYTGTFHYVRLLNEERGCWSLFFAGKNPESEWGFIEGDRYVSASERVANTLGDD